ncbi:RNI-like protein [Trichodelitschia bisporula]|uniref:RNI-like protein n=1 Tax=Trichodelitschia bisporula TaxID=703511 RepID=A0A6G1I848_9PEZI|nr:RNI-like protein [Trichodelitschia bisporula]
MRNASRDTVAPDSPTEILDDRGTNRSVIPLRHVVSVYTPEDGKPGFGIELVWLNQHTNQPSSMLLIVDDPDNRDLWLFVLKRCVHPAAMRDGEPISLHNRLCVRSYLEKCGDSSPEDSDMRLFKVVCRATAHPADQTPADEPSKEVKILVIGLYKVHLISLSKPDQAGAADGVVGESFGILTVSSLWLNEADHGFEMAHRLPLHPPKILRLASAMSEELACQLHRGFRRLHPTRPDTAIAFRGPGSLLDRMSDEPSPVEAGHDHFFDPVIAYCIAYDQDPSRIRYVASSDSANNLWFQLFPPPGTDEASYNVFELLAVMRALRYTSFVSISFSGVELDKLNGLFDPYGHEHVCTRTRLGTRIGLSKEEMKTSCLLIQEIRALAASNHGILSKIDFSNSIAKIPEDAMDYEDLGCGVLEALYPICSTECVVLPWINLSGIHLSARDIIYLINFAATRRTHLKALEVAGCHLNDSNLNKFLAALASQENTLEALNISRNGSAFFTPSATIGPKFSSFRNLASVNLSYLSVEPAPAPLISLEVLLNWRLNELILSHTTVNAATVRSIAQYLHSSQSHPLRLLMLDETTINGSSAAALIHSMTVQTANGLYLDISANPLESGFEELASVLGEDMGPNSLSMRLIDLEDEDFCSLLISLSNNSRVQVLDMAETSLSAPISDETALAVEGLFAKNKALTYLDLSGAESRLEGASFGPKFIPALRGLKENTALETLVIRHQKLGAEGASVLADVLRLNTTLRDLRCDGNALDQLAFSELLNGLYHNTAILNLSEMGGSRETETDRPAPISPNRSRQTSGKGRKSLRITRPALRMTKRDKLPKLKKTSSGTPEEQLAALSKVSSGDWEEENRRLRRYLERNKMIAAGFEVPLDWSENSSEGLVTPDSGLAPDTAWESPLTSDGNLDELDPSAETPRASILGGQKFDAESSWLPEMSSPSSIKLSRPETNTSNPEASSDALTMKEAKKYGR